MAPGWIIGLVGLVVPVLGCRLRSLDAPGGRGRAGLSGGLMGSGPCPPSFGPGLCVTLMQRRRELDLDELERELPHLEPLFPLVPGATRAEQREEQEHRTPHHDGDAAPEQETDDAKEPPQRVDPNDQAHDQDQGDQDHEAYFEQGVVHVDVVGLEPLEPRGAYLHPPECILARRILRRRAGRPAGEYGDLPLTRRHVVVCLNREHHGSGRQ